MESSSTDPPPYNMAKPVFTPTLNFTCKIEPISKLFHNRNNIVTPMQFHAGGYLWRIVVHSDGTSNNNIHFGLKLDSTSDNQPLPPGARVEAKFNVYVLSNGTFSKIAENQGSAVHFEEQNLFSWCRRYLPGFVLADSHFGILVDDSCMFGVEVLVCDTKFQRSCLSFYNGVSEKCSWKVTDFTKRFLKLQEKGFGNSPLFEVEDLMCEIICATPEYRTMTLGNGPMKLVEVPVSSSRSMTEIKNRVFSLYIRFHHISTEDDQSWHKEVYGKLLLRVRDQSTCEKHYVQEEEKFQWIGNEIFGWPKFMHLVDLMDPTNGYLVNDTVIIEAEVTVFASNKSLK